MISMGGLIKNEFLKLFRKKKFIIVLIVLFVLTFLSGFLSWYIVKMQSPKNKVSSYESAIKYYKSQLDDKKTTDKQKEELNNSIAQMQALLDQAKLDQKASSDWKKDAKDKIELYKTQKEDPKISLDSSQVENLNYQIKAQQYLIDNNIKPQDDSKFTALSGITYIMYFVNFLFLAVIVASLSADIVSGECTPPTIKILLTKPVSRAKLLFSKFITAVLASAGSILAVELIAFLVMGIFFGFGGFSQPMSFGTKYINDPAKIALAGKGLKAVLGSTIVITVGKALLLMLLFQLLYTIACAAFSFMISSITKTSAASLIISILSIVVMFIVTTILTASGNGAPWLYKILACFFTSYNDVASLLEGSLASKFYSPFLTPAFAAVVLVAWSVVCYVISHIVFTKKDILV